MVFNHFGQNALDAYTRSLKASRYSEQTIHAIKDSMVDFVRWAGQRTVRELGVEDFEAYFLHLQKRRGRNKKPISARTLADYRGILARWWDWLRERGYVDFTGNPVRAIRPIRQDENLVATYSQDAISTMAGLVDPRRYKTVGDKIIALRNRALLALLVDTPARRGELAALQVPDVDFEALTVRVVGKGRRERLMLIGSTTADYLDQWLAVREHLVAKNKHDYIWVKAGRGAGEPGTPLTGNALYQVIKDLAARAGIKKARVHAFRHTFAIGWLAADEEEATLRILMGVRSIPRTYLRTLAIRHAVEPYRRVSPMDSLTGRKKPKPKR